MDQFIRNYENFPKPGSKMNQIDRNENLGILEIPSMKIVMIWYVLTSKNIWGRPVRQEPCWYSFIKPSSPFGSHDGAISSKGWMLVTDVGDEMCWWPIYYVGKVTNILKKNHQHHRFWGVNSLFMKVNGRLQNSNYFE